MEKVGGHHSFQLRALVTLGLAFMHPAMLYSGLFFMLLIPTAMCENSSRVMRQCTLEQACRNQSHFLFSVQNERSVVFEWRLVCENESLRLLIPLVLLAGTVHTGLVLGSFLFAKAGEVLGRKKTLTWSLIASCVSEFILFCSASAYFFSGALLLVGLTLPGALFMPPLLLTEMMDSGHRAAFYFYLQLFACLGAVCSALLSYAMFTWRPLVLGSLGAGLLALVLVQRLKESPRYYAANLSRYQKARSIFQRMASTNRESMFEGTLVGEQMNEYVETGGHQAEKSEIPDQTADRSEILDNSGQHPVSYIDDSVKARESELERGQRCGFVHLCLYASCRSKSLRLFFTSFTTGLACTLNWHQPALVPSPYFALALHSFLYASLILVLLCFTAFIGRKISALLLVLLISITIGVLGTQSHVSLSPEAVTALYAATGLCSAGLWLVLGLWGMELMPTPVRSLVAGGCLGLGIAGSMVIPALGNGGQEGHWTVAVCSLLSLLLLSSLHETKTKPLQDFIEELSDSTAPVKEAPKPPGRPADFSPFNEAQD